MQNFKLHKFDFNSSISYLICFTNLTVGLAFIYFNDSLMPYIAQTVAAPLNPFSHPIIFLGYLVNSHNLHIAFQYVFALSFVGYSLSNYFQIRQPACCFPKIYISTALFWIGAYISYSIAFQGVATSCFVQCFP